MKNHVSTAANLATGTITTNLSKPVQLMAAFFLGMVILSGAVFAQSPAVHDAAHDMRHSAGFPCH